MKRILNRIVKDPKRLIFVTNPKLLMQIPGVDKMVEMGIEDMGMAQALYSRSAASFLEHLKDVLKKGSAGFMKRWYVGYQHDSIGDCATDTLLLENVSILADKEIQNTPLYNGQEVSTRYLDMSKQDIVSPLDTEEAAEIMHRWMRFYEKAMQPLIEFLKTQRPQPDSNEEKVLEAYQLAIKARAFDILRAFLPAGICTQLSWHTSLRHAANRIQEMRHHPLTEVRNIVHELHAKLLEAYPSSFGHKTYEDKEAYTELCRKELAYYHNPKSAAFQYQCFVDKVELSKYATLLSKRPQKTNLPREINECGDFLCEFSIDYGSSRDLQRHRNGIFRMPLLTTEMGFHPWYLKQLPDDLRKEAEILIAEQTELINKLDTSPEVKQYYISLGFLVSCKIRYNIGEMIYVAELRSGKTVHENCRVIAQNLHHALVTELPEVSMYTNLDEDGWTIERGKHTITKKD